MDKDYFIEKAKKVHGDKYDYSLVEYIGNHKKTKIICPEHGVFEQAPSDHLSGSGCVKCGINKRNEKTNITTADFIKKARNIHGDKYDYSLTEYVNAKTNIKIICKEHRAFEQAPSRHLSGSGCVKCRIEKNTSSNKIITTQIFIEEAKEVHGDRYDYSLAEYTKAIEKVKIICKEHGVFEQIPNNHLKGHGCSACAGMKKLTTEAFIKKQEMFTKINMITH